MKLWDPSDDSAEKKGLLSIPVFLLSVWDSPGGLAWKLCD